MLALLARLAQGRQRVGRLARLRHEHRKVAVAAGRVAITELRGDVDFDRHPRKALEPVFRHQAGVIGRPASRDRGALQGAEIERQLLRQDHAAVGHVEIARERVADHLGLLGDLLGHEAGGSRPHDQERGGDRLEAPGGARSGRRSANRRALRRTTTRWPSSEVAHRVGERRSAIASEAIHLRPRHSAARRAARRARRRT